MQHNLKIQIWSIEDGEQETQTDKSKAKQRNATQRYELLRTSANVVQFGSRLLRPSGWLIF